ncbi:MAG: sigma-70 family RNA polymerase sigma factor, partial [Planctomycetes bacterium]|nr:sigma-70 family RNA polymerase sigma factor [Planctomycetota bacterium]
MNSDAALVARYARTRDAEALAELFRRYGGLVHGTCLRMTGNLHDAEDLAQGCFMDLARQCETIRDSLPGWLHRVAINRSSQLMRGESRRRRREEARARAASSQDDWAQLWEQTAPHVDEAVCDLPDELRLPIILHFLQGKTQAEVSQELGIDRSTVSRRLQKGVDRLRGEMKKAGIIISAGLLAALLERNAAQAAPAGLVAAVGRMAIAGVGTESGASPTLGKAHRGVKHPTAHTWKGLIMKVTAIAAAGAALVLAAVVIAGNRPGAAQPPAPVGPGEPPTIETWPNLPQLALPIADIDAIVGIDKAGKSADVRRLLKSNGFAVAPKYYHQIFSPYIQEHLPAFVTCDSLHRTFHVIFEEQLKRLETGMAADVTKVTTLMAQSIRARDNEERGAAASALSAVADERDLPALKNVALNADRRQRGAAINILGKMRAPAVKETLIDLLRSTPHPDSVHSLVYVFRSRGSKDVTPHLLDAWPDASRDARSSIIEALATIW